MGTDPRDFFRKPAGKWDPEKYVRRKPLSTLVNRRIVIERAPSGSQEWKKGLLLAKDAQTGEILASVAATGFLDPATGWNLRIDC